MDTENVVYAYNEILFCHKRKEILPYAITWKNFEVIILSEISQS